MPIDEQLTHDIVKLAREGMTWRAIARALKISRNTVRAVMSEHEHRREQPHSVLVPQRQRQRPSKLDPFQKKIDELLHAYPNITAQRIFEILRENGFDGGYTRVKELVRRLRPRKAPQPSLETAPREPGEMAECDWSPYPVTFTHAPAMTLQAFSYTLRYSTRKCYSFHEGTGLPVR